MDWTLALGFRSSHRSAVAELDAVLPGAPKRSRFDKNEDRFPNLQFLASQECRGAMHSRFALLNADPMAMSTRANFIFMETDPPGLLSLTSRDYSRD